MIDVVLCHCCILAAVSVVFLITFKNILSDVRDTIGTIQLYLI